MTHVPPWHLRQSSSQRMEVLPQPDLCKHGKGDCDLCGVTLRRDAQHATTAGKGAVARLRKKRKRV